MSPLLRRAGALVASSVLVVSGATLLSAPAQAIPAPTPTSQGADWLAGQLTNGLMHNPNFGGFDDYGLSIDTAIALHTVGGHDDAVAAIGKAIRNNYYSYTTGDDFGSTTSYGGGIAKALYLQEIAGTGPVSYQQAVLADLENHIATSSPIAGRIQNFDDFVYPPPDYNPVPGDSANVIGQIYTARALMPYVTPEAATSLDFLLAQQCSAGFFREQFTADKTAADQTCDGASPAADPSIDTTAIAVINLAMFPSSGPVDAAIANARAWLKTQQGQDGSFDGGNANSTGLVAWALGASAASTGAADWIRDHQADNADACTALAGSVGAIAFDDAGLAAGRTDGITLAKQDEWRRATTQALPALQFAIAPSPATLALTGPTGFVRASTAATYVVTGANAGGRLCVSTTGAAKAGTANGTGVASIAPVLPAGTANRTVTVTDRDGNTAAVLTKVLGTKTLTIKPATRQVVHGKLVQVTVSGLAPGESVTLRYRGVALVAGKAGAAGTFVRNINVGQRLGSATISATGEFASIRRGSTTITVIR